MVLHRPLPLKKKETAARVGSSPAGWVKKCRTARMRLMMVNGSIKTVNDCRRVKQVFSDGLTSSRLKKPAEKQVQTRLPSNQAIAFALASCLNDE